MIFFLYGSDSFRRRQKLKALIQHFQDKVDKLGQSLSFIDAPKATLRDIQEKIGSASLFAKKRMLVIEDVFANKNEAVIKLLAEKAASQVEQEANILVFTSDEIKETQLKAEAKKLYRWLKKQPYAQEFKSLNNVQLLDFAKKSIEEKGGKIAMRTLSLLIARTGDDLWRLDNEVSKLIALSQGGVITEEMINELISSESEENIFAFTDALSNKNRALALQLLEEQFAAGLSENYILAMCQRQFKIMLEIKMLQQEKGKSANVAKELKLHPYVARKSQTQSLKFNLEELSEYLERLMKLDLNIRKGKADIKSELYLLVSQLV